MHGGSLKDEQVADYFARVGDDPYVLRTHVDIDRGTHARLEDLQRVMQELADLLGAAHEGLTRALIKWRAFSDHVQQHVRQEPLYAEADKMPQEGPETDATP